VARAIPRDATAASSPGVAPMGPATAVRMGMVPGPPCNAAARVPTRRLASDPNGEDSPSLLLSNWIDITEIFDYNSGFGF
jgi:hypothetical protein